MKHKIIFFVFLFSSQTILYAQNENSFKGKTGPIIVSTSDKEPTILLDGLILSKLDYLNLNIANPYSKKFKIKALDENEAKKRYGIINKDGIVEIKTHLLYILDNEVLTSESKEKLSKLKQATILEIKFNIKEDAIKEFGKLGRNGAFIIKAKK